MYVDFLLNRGVNPQWGGGLNKFPWEFHVCFRISAISKLSQHFKSSYHPCLNISNKNNFTGKLTEFTLSRIPETNFALTKCPELKTQEWWLWID